MWCFRRFAALVTGRAFILGLLTVLLWGIQTGRAAADTNDPFAPFVRQLGTNPPKAFLTLGTNQFDAVLAAAEKGDTGAQLFVGDCYWRGSVVTQSLTAAVGWYRKAAEQGNASAQFTLGACLLEGLGVSKDEAEAFNWVRKAAEKHYAPAFGSLARFYEKGWGGVATNTAEAVRWYRQAADRRDGWAQLRLGQLYAEGLSVARDPVEALKWYELASRDGKQSAENAREEAARLAATLPVSDVIEARRRASAFVGNVLSATNVSTPAPALAAQMTIEVPMELNRNCPVVSVRVNGSKPLRLLFDSGSAMSILTEKAASKLKLKGTSKVQINSIPVDITEGVTFSLAGASYRPRAVALHPMKWSRILDPFLDGTLGADLLEHFVVELDYRAKRMRLHDLSKYKYTGSGENLLMRFDGNRPYIDANILPQTGKSVKGTWLIDTGAAGELFVARRFADEHFLAEAAGKTLAGKAVVFDGTAKFRSGEFKKLHVGHFVLDKPKVILDEGTVGFGSQSGAIGVEILRRFKVIFHYGRQQLTLEPNGLSPKPYLSGETGSELLN